MATIIGVPAAISSGYLFMTGRVQPVKEGALLKELTRCSKQFENCDRCPFYDQCLALYSSLVDHNKIISEDRHGKIRQFIE